MAVAINIVTVFVAIIGKLFMSKPYASQSVMPAKKMRNVPRERSFADLVLQIFHAWGMKATVVSAPASSPTSFTVSSSMLGVCIDKY